MPLPTTLESEKGFRPYVKVDLHVEPPPSAAFGTASFSPPPVDPEADERAAGEYKMRSRTNKGRDVDFRGEALQFLGVPGVVEELTFVRFIVRNDESLGRDQLAAWASVRLDRLRAGYRFVHLLDAKGGITDGALLVKIEKKLT